MPIIYVNSVFSFFVWHQAESHHFHHISKYIFGFHYLIITFWIQFHFIYLNKFMKMCKKVRFRGISFLKDYKAKR